MDRGGSFILEQTNYRQGGTGGKRNNTNIRHLLRCWQSNGHLKTAEKLKKCKAETKSRDKLAKWISSNWKTCVMQRKVFIIINNTSGATVSCHPNHWLLASFVRIVHLPLNLERILASSLLILLISASLLLPENRSRYDARYVMFFVLTALLLFDKMWEIKKKHFLFSS